MLKFELKNNSLYKIAIISVKKMRYRAVKFLTVSKKILI